jgi:tetratricopeptide (TPR) repeat protein
MSEKQSHFTSFPVLCSVSGVVCLISTGYFIYLSGQRQLSQLENSLFQVISIVAGTVAGAKAGEWAAKDNNKAFVSSALRRVYSIADELQSTQDKILDYSQSLPANPEEISQLWTKMALETISTQVSSVKNQAEQSIADWGELLGEEYEQLRKNQKEKDTAISELSEQLNKLQQHIESSSSSEITKTLESQYVGLEKKLQHVRSKSVLLGGYKQSPQRGEAKKFMDEGKFEEAVKVYDQIIRNYPSTHTNYLGRARAKYSARDLSGALEDLKIAETMQPSDSGIDRLRQELVNDILSRGLVEQNASSIAYDANTLLSYGQIESARKLYQHAKEKGLRDYFSSINFTMVELLANNPSLAREALLGFNHNVSGDYMRVQIEALKALCDVVEGKPVNLIHLQKALDTCSNFSILKSPLQFLEIGMINLNMLNSGGKIIFSALKHEQKAAATSNS